MAVEWIRFLIAAFFLVFGVSAEVRAMIGVYRMNYVLNRMQVAATGDTLGILSILVGLDILSGFSIMMAKFTMIIIFFWITSPVSSHLISEIEVVTNPKADEEFEVKKL